jgi:thiol-disulfide isomerase/thioredoxin
MRQFLAFTALAVVCASTALALADDGPAIPDEKFGDTPQLDKIDFPPGAFSDGGHYRLSDFRGKVLVLYFYESACPTARSLVPERSALVEKYKDQPVRFIAVDPHDSLADARSYVGETKLAMPAFADTLGIMEQRFGIDISMNNIYQTRIIGPDGQLAGEWSLPKEDQIDAALKNATWKYKDDGYDPRLSGAIDMLEWNQFETGMRMLRPYLKNIGKTGESAKKLFAAVRVEGQQWADEAKACETTDPGHAMDLYNRLATCFPTDDLGTSATASLKALKINKAAQNELAARQMFARLYMVMPQVTSSAKQQVIAYCNSIVEKYPDTATAKRAQRLASDLQAAPAPHDQ